MKLLLDACTFLWLAIESSRLSQSAKSALEDAENEVLLSAASAWEISLKYSSGKLPLPQPPELYVPQFRNRYGIESLDISEPAALYVHNLPSVHADPFDRMLVSQAIMHGLVIVTPDPLIHQYPVRTLW